MMVTSLANDHVTMDKDEGEVTKEFKALEAEPALVGRGRVVKLDGAVSRTAAGRKKGRVSMLYVEGLRTTTKCSVW